MIRAALILIFASLFWAAGFLIGCRKGMDRAEPVVRTKTVYADREITRRDTITVDRPVVRRIYERTTDTVYVRVPVPRDFVLAGLIHPSPVRIDGRRVTLTYFAPDSLRFIQDVYTVPERRWGLFADTGGQCSPLGCVADVRANLRYRGLTVHGGYGVVDGVRPQLGAGWTAGIRLKLIGRR